MLFFCYTFVPTITNNMTTIEEIIKDIQDYKDFKVKKGFNYGWSVLTSGNDIMIIVTRVEDLDETISINNELEIYGNKIYDFNIKWAISPIVSISPVLTRNYNLIATI